ncbi:MAG: TlpA disulfide reductase family protein [Bacteroidota bacterium]
MINNMFGLAAVLFFAGYLQAQEVITYHDFNTYNVALSKTIGENEAVIVNYWATWCAPCIKELPYFEELSASYPDVKVLLVSVDFAKDHDKRLIPFIDRKQLSLPVIHMADPKANDWIDRIDPDWSGAIPATLFYSGERKQFVEKEYKTFEELEEEYLTFIKS